MDLDIYGSAAAGTSNGSAAASQYGSPVAGPALEPGGKSQSHLMRIACPTGSPAAAQVQPPHIMNGILPSARVLVRQTRVIPSMSQDAPSPRAHDRAGRGFAAPHQPRPAGHPMVPIPPSVFHGAPNAQAGHCGALVVPVSKGKRVKKIGS
jgi:hypothetical protein